MISAVAGVMLSLSRLAACDKTLPAWIARPKWVRWSHVAFREGRPQAGSRASAEFWGQPGSAVF